VTWVSRERTEFKFQLATLNINPHSKVEMKVGHRRGETSGICSRREHRGWRARL